MSDYKNLPVFRVYFSAMIIFFFLRLAFFIYHYPLFDNCAATSIFQVFLNGLMVDSAVTASSLFLIRLISLLIELINRKVARKIYLILLSLLFGLYFFINLADIFYFEMFDSRLNILLLENIDQLKPGVQSVFADYPIYIVTPVWILILVSFIWFIHKQKSTTKWILAEQYHKTTTVISMVALVVLSFLWTGSDRTIQQIRNRHPAGQLGILDRHWLFNREPQPHPARMAGLPGGKRTLHPGLLYPANRRVTENSFPLLPANHIWCAGRRGIVVIQIIY